MNLVYGLAYKRVFYGSIIEASRRKIVASWGLFLKGLPEFSLLDARDKIKIS